MGLNEKLDEKVKAAGLQDGMRVSLFRQMLETTDADTLLYYTNKIDEENFYRFKALTEAAVMLGDYTVVLTPKELIPVLRDAATDNRDKYLNADFKHAYHFVSAYNRVHKNKFGALVTEILSRGGDRARWAMLSSFNAEYVNVTYAHEIFSHPLTCEELSFFRYRIDVSRLAKKVLAEAFENLFGMLMGMDKVSYHYKTDDDIGFARDLSRSDITSLLGEIAARSDNAEYISRLDSVYDSLKEEAQARYLTAIGDKTNLDTRSCAVKFLKTDNYYAQKYYNSQKIKLTFDEAVEVSDYLKTKRESLKSKIITEYLASDECDKIADYLLSQSEEYKKAAGEEIKASGGKVDKQKLANPKAEIFRWEHKSVFTVEKPVDEIKKLAAVKSGVKPLKPIGYTKTKKFFGAIENFIDEHRDYEYAANFGEELMRFGAGFHRLKDSEWGNESFGAYPLGEELKKLIGGFPQEEIAGALALAHCVNAGNKDLYIAVCGNRAFYDDGWKYNYLNKTEQGRRLFETSPLIIMRDLCGAIMNELLSEDTALRLVAAFAQKRALGTYPVKKENDSVIYGGYRRVSGYPYVLLRALAKSNDKNVIKEQIQFECAFVNADLSDSPGTLLMIKAYEYGFISDKLVNYFILSNGTLQTFYAAKSENSVLCRDYKYPKFKKLLGEFTENALAVEFARGSLQTQYSEILSRTGRFIGADKFVTAIAALRGLTLVRSPYGYDKNEVLSHILKNTVKAEDDTYEKFAALTEEYRITDDELLRATLFNPEFADYAAIKLNIPYLKTAVFWFVAHLNESLYGDKQERRIEQIKEFSAISYPDFQDGAFDCEWYAEMAEKVDKKTLERIYADAKYVTVGGLHKRAQRFFDAVNGRIDKAACIEKMNATRNKDYCLIYSLIPVQDRKDLCERYTTLAEFARTGKQFGAQRQLSERRTVDIALENLARTAGYASTDIFMFEMEAEEQSDIYGEYAVEDITLSLCIDEQKLKWELNISKDGKKLSSLPAKYSKHETAVFLREQVKQLNRKIRRIITGLENCMCSRVPFDPDRLAAMCRERSIAAVLGRLILLANGRLCVYKGGITYLDGEKVQSGEVYIAHPTELRKLGLLQDAIGYVVKNNIRQPFKQALREIYTKTDLEYTQDAVVRFQGFEVDCRKCVAALKGKGWGVSEDIGLRKVYYRTDTVAAIFREFDFFYTVDFENENRELDSIYFLNRKSGDIIPLREVDDITFSETLRDVDLMISISSKVIYDYRMAMSTVEMRHEVLKSIADILSLGSVSFIKDNVMVVGHYGTYTVNIRTGLVFKDGRGCLALDTVYSVDKPILLDFVDEDPMTADIISKAVLLANDKTIKDPTILREIKN